jgi:hypothetical protein
MINREMITILKRIKKMSKKDFSKFVRKADDGLIDDLCECVYNVINTDLNFKKRKKTCLKQHIHKNCSKIRLKKIMNKKLPLSKRRTALKQEGRGIPFLLASAIPFLTSLFMKK